MKPGDKFVYKNIDFICLDIIEGNYLAMTAKPRKELPFDTDKSNYWSQSSLRKYLNNDFLDLLDKEDLVKQTSDLIADNGDGAYGTCKDYVTILSCDQYRKYRNIVPLFEEWMWTLTPLSCNDDVAVFRVRVVSATGNFNNDLALNSNGVAPVVLFNKDPFDKIKIGDEVYCKDCVDIKFVVTYVDDSLHYISGFNSFGVFVHRPIARWEKSGKHYPEIEKIINNRKGI